MEWQNLTRRDFLKAREEAGRTCIVPCGILEIHGEHLPIGTDYLNVHKACCMAAEIEPCMVFPPFYFGKIFEGKPYPGSIALNPRILLDMMMNLLDEIGRNGFDKIILYNGHGGNKHWLQFIAQCQQWEEKPYFVFYTMGPLNDEEKKEWGELCPTGGAHAHDAETSVSLVNHEHLVKMEYIPTDEKAGESLGRLWHLGPGYSAIEWYSEFPEHYSGKAREANKEKGARLRDLHVGAIARTIKAVKEDTTALELQKEFFERARDPK